MRTWNRRKINEKVRKVQEHPPEVLPCTVVQAVHSTRVPSQRGYKGAVVLLAKPSALQLAASAQRGCLFLIHLKILFRASEGPISCLLLSNEAPQDHPHAKVQGKVWGVPQGPKYSL